MNKHRAVWVKRIPLAVANSQMQGQSLVEMALILPVLLLMMAGIADLGRAFQIHSILTDAAREGTHYATFHADDRTGIGAKVVNAVAGTGISIANQSAGTVTIANQSACPDICVIYPDSNLDTTGEPVQVRVRYQYSTILGTILGFNSLTIQANNVAVIIGQ